MNYQTALTAMAVWEYLSQTNEPYLPYEWIGDVGAYEHRVVCLEEIAPAVEQARRAFPEEAINRLQLHAYDWEWIPLYIDTAVELGISPGELFGHQDRIIDAMLWPRG